jgi:hypothetical protein
MQNPCLVVKPESEGLHYPSAFLSPYPPTPSHLTRRVPCKAQPGACKVTFFGNYRVLAGDG